MLRLELLSKNLEAAVCFALFGVLVFVSVHLLKPEMEEADSSIPRRGGVSASEMQTKYMAARRETALQERRILMGSIMARPISHYGLILRHNPFAPIPPFEGVIVRHEDFVLVSAPSRETGSWIAIIQHRITGEVYSVGEGEEIAGVLRVKKIEWDKVILTWKESYDVVFEAPEAAATSNDLTLVTAPAQLEQHTWVASIKNRRTGKIYKVQVGDRIENFTVKEIDAGRVVITDGTQEIILTPPFIISEPPFALILTGTIEIKEQKVWIAQIENRITGKTYFKREGEQIEDIFTVGKIERNKLILLEEGEEDRVLKLGQTGD